MLKIKTIGVQMCWMLTMLILFAGCGDKNDSGAQASAAWLVAETVNCNATTNKIVTEGAASLTFTAAITEQGAEPWCSFELNTPLTEFTGKVGAPVYLYLKQNTLKQDRTATIVVRYTDNYTVTLTLTQTAFSSSADFDRAWGEQPQFKSSTDYVYKTYFTTLDRGNYTRSYSICYDLDKRVSRWVAYPMHSTYTTPNVGRTDAWAYDPNKQLPVIPDKAQQYILRGYGVRGYDRGHMLASASRYSTVATNEQTFYATNMMPQNSSFNQNIWGTLEGKERSWMVADTLFVVTGTIFEDSKTISNANGPIAVPTHCWKVMLRTRRGNTKKAIADCTADELKAIGFLFTNDAAGAATSIANAVRSVAEIEQKSGFTFFRNLPADVADAVKNQKKYSEW
ncbi:MAG: DNA/RNA non-specific endonuclease [Alistipes sp.]